MAKDLIGMGRIDNILGYNPLAQSSKKKRVQLTPGQRVKVWENPRMYGRKCSICGGRISKLSDLQLDHTKPYSQGGTKLNLAHKDCNAIKGSKSLSHIQTKMGFKKTSKRAKAKSKPKKKRRVSSSSYGLTGFKMPTYKAPTFKVPKFKI